MKFSLPAIAVALGAITASASPVELVERATPTVYLCGDSTMAKNGANDGSTDGWGQYFGALSSATVVNKAIGGRSARSYTVEGRFTEVANLVKSGDIVVIEFGHNDGGSPESNDNGRSDCPGAGTETCTSSKDGSTVYTFVYYVIQAAKLMVSKGATVVLSSQTPNNAWEGGSFSYSPPRFVGYVKTAANAIASSSVTYVDHYNAQTLAYKKLGNSGTNALYPNDHTHTSPAGAKLAAQAFAQAINAKMNGTTSLTSYILQPAPSVY